MSSLQRQILTPKAAALLKLSERTVEGSLKDADEPTFQAPSSPAKRVRKDYSPTSWDQCFDSCTDVAVPGLNLHTFRVYQIEPAERPATGHAPLFILHHGAGHSGLSFGLTARQIKRITFGRAAVLTYDCRGHGRLVHAIDVA
ncbi:hypothetical protein BC936DRAFT_142566 [Jimgerdemannia flammicorona]|uniref:Uncharacterized protein n=1 Tax=Jimgerdemannia flammicorona TaxID=994334 RepID=A0A433A0N5_9FUNG|nr:hypothetical protein BC936DRAFT_142566 [Jimgerdemannia flammicorona]